MSNTNIVKLLKIEPGSNNNKYYNMSKSDNATEFNVEYGRVGSNPQKETYPLHKWSIKYNEKIKKGYQDITSMATEVKSKGNVKIADESEVEKLILALQSYANVSISNTYLVDSNSVTKTQLDSAQTVLNNLTKGFNKHWGKKTWNTKSFNDELLKLYLAIPRKMKNVKDHVIADGDSQERISKLLSEEQDNLDSILSQYSSNNAPQKDENNNTQTLLEALGLSITYKVTKKEKTEIEKLMAKDSRRIKNIYRVINHTTQKLFDEKLSNNKNKLIKNYFHGSRSQNFWFILQQGLKIRPSNAVYTGSLLGDAIYFAPKAQKSIGYTSLSGSYWVGGSSQVGYLAIFDVLQGNALEMKTKTFAITNPKRDLWDKGYDSVFAHAGSKMGGYSELKNDEMTIYDNSQCTIKYLIEITN